VADVSLHGVGKAYDGVGVVHDIDLAVAAGEFVCFVGPSGCGKSTLLRLIAGLDDVTTGEIRIGGERVDDRPPAQRGVAMVFQSYALYPHMTVYQNMAFGLRLAKTSRAAVRDRVTATARMLQIDGLLDRLPRQLSGGQRQRVAIGRALVRQPRVFLFDEPLSNLDAGLRQQMRVEIARLHAQIDATMIYVTHDQVEAMTLADRIVVLRDGRVEQVGEPLRLYHEPANRFVAGFIGSPPMNFLPATLLGDDPAGALVSLAGGARLRVDADAAGIAPGAGVTCGIRPEHLQLSPPSDTLPAGSVVLVERLGDHSLVLVRMDRSDEIVTVRVAPGAELATGTTLGLTLPSAHCHLFDSGDRACPRKSSRPG
jgi:multiple sugar transport system ATP-binding protein